MAQPKNANIFGGNDENTSTGRIEFQLGPKFYPKRGHNAKSFPVNCGEAYIAYGKLIFKVRAKEKYQVDLSEIGITQEVVLTIKLRKDEVLARRKTAAEINQVLIALQEAKININVMLVGDKKTGEYLLVSPNFSDPEKPKDKAAGKDEEVEAPF